MNRYKIIGSFFTVPRNQLQTTDLDLFHRETKLGIFTGEITMNPDSTLSGKLEDAFGTSEIQGNLVARYPGKPARLSFTKKYMSGSKGPKEEIKYEFLEGIQPDTDSVVPVGFYGAWEISSQGKTTSGNAMCTLIAVEHTGA